ncbi:MAG: hypothetical protein BGO78_17435 [Chloroflexi bacterium 44-23]|nr:MAG: hypothetical protein BGO78_17435 [Chloroflexi bacterium 44-23]
MKSRIEQAKVFFLNFLPLIFVLLFAFTPQPRSILKNWQDIQELKQQDNPALLINRYLALLRQQPWQYDIREQLAQLQYDNGDFAGAIESLSILSENRELTVPQQFILANSYQKNKQSDLAVKTWQEIAERTDLNVEDLSVLLEKQEDNRDRHGAFVTIKRWAALEPLNGKVQYRLALYQIIFDPASASRTLLQALQKMPQRKESIDRLVTDINLMANQQDDAYRLVLAGKSISNEGEWLLASFAFEEATQINPDYAEGWAFLGNAYSYLGENGLPALEKANELNPNSILVKAYLASYWRSQDQFSRSLAIYEDLAKLEPEQAFWLYEMGRTIAQSGDPQLGMTKLMEAVQLSPKDIFFWKALVNFSLDYNFLVETNGLEAARQALVIAPDDPEVNDLMGQIQLRMENYKSAERFLIKASKLQPYSALIQFHLGQLYYLEGEYNLSYFYLKNAADYAQNETLAHAAEDLLNRMGLGK